MSAPLPHDPFSELQLGADDVQALLHATRRLKREAQAGAQPPLLRGKNIAVLCASPGCDEAELFEAAARRLGARVSHVPADKALVWDDDGDSESIRMLGKLYDALECDQPEEVAERVQREAGIPVFNGVTRPEHPLQQLLNAPPQALDDEDPLVPADRPFLLQAMLVSALG